VHKAQIRWNETIANTLLPAKLMRVENDFKRANGIARTADVEKYHYTAHIHVSCDKIGYCGRWRDCHLGEAGLHSHSLNGQRATVSGRAGAGILPKLRLFTNDTSRRCSGLNFGNITTDLCREPLDVSNPRIRLQFAATISTP
jgi:hypothetical protein